MKQYCIFCLVILVGLTGCSTSTSKSVEPGPRVMIIGVDGMSPDGIRQADTPHLDALMAGGAYSFTARAVLPSSSSPNWASMIMGAGPEQHGITSNDWEPDDFSIVPTAAGVGPIFPSIFDLLRQQQPDAVSAAIYDWGGFGRLYNKAAVTVDINADGPQAAADAAVQTLTDRQPTLTFVHLDHVDGAGHGFGHGTPQYYAAVEEADRLIGEILDGLEAAGLREETTIIVSADHGGRGKGHGGESMDEMQIPWIINGPGVVAGTVIDDPIDTFDTAATAAYVLGLGPPYAWIARPVYAALQNPRRPEPETPGIAGVEHVVVVGVDGMSPDGVQKARTPVLNRLLDEGAFSFEARAVLTTSSSQNWASMIMGAGPEQHGITSNDWERDTFLLEPTVAGPEELFPTIFSVLRSAEPDAYIASIYDWDGFGRLFQKTTVDADIDADGPQDAVDKARAQFKAHQPRLTFIHLDHVDHAGHAHGHGSDEYYASVEEADRLIGAVLDGLQDAGMADRTLLLISADHGGRGKGHGGESMDEVEIPWIAHGPGVVAGKVLSVPIDTYDTAATVLFALGVAPPPAWIARPVRAAFTRFHDDAEPLGIYVPEPRIKPVSGFFRAALPTVTMTVDDPDAVIRYTLDGSEPGASSPRYEGPIRITENTQVKACTFKGTTASTASEAAYRIVPPDQPRNVRYTYYEGSWNALPDFEQVQPLHTGSVYEFRVDGIEKKREDHFGLKLEGTIALEQTGEYTFYLTSDDGSKLYVDGVEVVDNDGDHGSITRQGTVDLEAGPHQIVVTYFENAGGEFLEVMYAGPGVEKQVLSFDKFLVP